VGYRGTASDITDLHDTEERLRQAQKMEAVGQLTGGVAHDFNNLLAIILGNAEMLLEDLGQENARVQAVIRAATRGADLTQRLLAFSRRQPLRPEPIDLGSLVAGMMDMLRRSLGEAIDISFVPDKGLRTATADPGLLENALLNLAINARDAMAGAGNLVIETTNAVLDESYAATRTDVVAGDYVLLTVTDTGDGMSPEVLKRAFEPFFTTKDIGKGSGLGLSMIFGFAKQSGGHVAIYSEEGKGTTVKLYLPQTGAKAKHMEVSAREDVPRGRGETVLVVEDDGDVRELAVLLLEELGYEVIEARDGKSGLAVLEEVPGIDLLLADMVLAGGMSGRDLANEATRQNGGLKVLFMSGYAENAAQLNGWVNATRGNLEPLLRAAASIDSEDIRHDPRPAALHPVILDLATDTRTAKVKIFNLTGLTVFSTDPAQIGEQRGLYSRLLAAIENRTTSEIEHGEAYTDFAGNRVKADLLSSYLPIHGGDGQVIGVFEHYTDVTAFKAQIIAAEGFKLVILLLSFGAVYGLSLATVAAGSRIIARKHQENLELAAAMAHAQAADRAKSEFLANMSHELRTPLNAIIGFSEIIKDQSFGPIEPSRYRDYAVDIHQSGQRLLEIIDNVLDLVKIEAGAAQPVLTEIDPARLIDTAVARIRDQAEAAEVNLTLRLAQELPSMLTDPRRLNQVLTGILANAIKFTPQGGRVSVRARWNEAADRIEISVADTGIGIAPTDIPVTLAPFGRVDGAANSRYPGAGLGLPLAKRFTELLGGEIEIQSRLGRGTEITVRLPRAGRHRTKHDRPNTSKRTAA